MFLSRKRQHSSTTTTTTTKSFIPPFAQPPISKCPKSTAGISPCNPKLTTCSAVSPPSSTDIFLSVLAEAGCTLNNPPAPPCLPSDLHKLRHRLHLRFADDATLRSSFLLGLSSYINTPHDNLRRVLLPSHCDNMKSTRSESFMRVLLLVESIQLDVQNTLLEKLPEYFDMDPAKSCSASVSMRLEEDVARLIIHQFRWLDFIVDSQAFTEKLLQVLSICPIHLQREIIGSLPEIIGENNNKFVVDSLQEMLQEDSSIVVTVLDTFSNLNLDDLLQDQVISIALSCIRSVEVEQMSCVLRFLLLSATPTNAPLVISKIREQLKFIGLSDFRSTQKSKLKGKSVVDNVEASILSALKSGLQFKSILCHEIMKELKSLEKAQDHKVIDVWLLILIHMSCESLQKSAQKLLKKKVLEGCIEEDMFGKCIQGNKDLAQDYLSTLLCMSGYLLACKEKKAAKFGSQMYQCLFEEFHNTYSRQEILGALITHVGSGIGHEVGNSLETMLQLTSKYPQELIRLSSHVTGILDYLESFSSEGLHKVYEVFSLLALSVRSSGEHVGFSVANELMMIVRKQLCNPDIAYKKMGLIGALKIVSYLGDANASSSPLPCQKSNSEEALELLKTSFDSCKKSQLPLIFFYEDLTATVQKKALHPLILEWVGKHVGELESAYLLDLNGGQLPFKSCYCGLEGELWMNLDGDISPVCLNIMPLASSSLAAASPLQSLPAYFVLLSVIERLSNHGSLGGIDALLGCPLHIPSSKYLSDVIWQSLSNKQKQNVVLCYYYATNWIRELVNAFSTQIAENFDSVSQSSKEEILLKLMKRLRNLVFLESLLNEALKRHPLPLPDLCSSVDPVMNSHQNHHLGDWEKRNELTQKNTFASQNRKRKNNKSLRASETSDVNAKSKQPTLVDVWKKAGVITSQEAANQDSSGKACDAGTSEDRGKVATDCNPVITTVNVSEAVKMVELQRYKFRPLRFSCVSILSFSKNSDSCCSDPAAELPLYLYLVRDLHQKLENLSPLGKHFSPRCTTTTHLDFSETKDADFLNYICPLFPSLKRQLDRAICSLREGGEICDSHWKDQSSSAGNPEISDMVFTYSSVPSLLITETLGCFGKMVNLPNILGDKSSLFAILNAFRTVEVPDSFFQGMNLFPLSGSIDHLYCASYCYLEGILDVERLSFKLATEVVLVIESLVMSIQKLIEKSINESAKDLRSEFTKDHLQFLRHRLGTSAKKLLFEMNDDLMIDHSLKTKGELLQKILHIYLNNSKSSSDSLHEIACKFLPQGLEDDKNNFPVLVWYRIMHEENLTLISNLVKEAGQSHKPRTGSKDDNVGKLLSKLQQSVDIVVSLVSICRTNKKVNMHIMAVKYGGKFVDSFLKVFDFLQAQFVLHHEQIIEMVKELQKATRTIQTLCSEAKASKQTSIASKIPATKRSMERFLFHVKALVHATPSECTFWMGNLKHKNLMGHIVSSQAYLDNLSETADEMHHGETVVQSEPENDDESMSIADE